MNDFLLKYRPYLVDLACLVPITAVTAVLAFDGSFTDPKTLIASVAVAVARTILPQIISLIGRIRDDYGSKA